MLGLKIFLAILGLGVFVFGQILLEFSIKPMCERQKLIGEIIYSLHFYQSEYLKLKNERPEKLDEISLIFRKQGCQLRPRTYATRLTGFFEWLLKVPIYDDILKASEELMEISKNIHHGKADKNKKSAEKIANLLNFRIYFE